MSCVQLQDAIGFMVAAAHHIHSTQVEYGSSKCLLCTLRAYQHTNELQWILQMSIAVIIESVCN